MLNDYEWIERPVKVRESVVSERCIEVILEEEIIVPPVLTVAVNRAIIHHKIISYPTVLWLEVITIEHLGTSRNLCQSLCNSHIDNAVDQPNVSSLSCEECWISYIKCTPIKGHPFVGRPIHEK
jgi:hypothetical protein